MEKNIFEKLAVKSKFQKLEIFFFFIKRSKCFENNENGRLMAINGKLELDVLIVTSLEIYGEDILFFQVYVKNNKFC